MVVKILWLSSYRETNLLHRPAEKSSSFSLQVLPRQTPGGGGLSISGQSPLPKASKEWRLDKQFVPDTHQGSRIFQAMIISSEHIFQEVLMLVYEEK